MFDALLTQAPALMPGGVAALGLGALLGSARILRPASMERVSELLGADDPVVGLLLWALCALGVLWLGYELSLRLAGGSEDAVLALQVSAAAGATGVVLGETLRARRDGTASPLSRAMAGLFDPSALMDLLPGRRVSARTELRMACALYLFDAQVPDALIRNSLSTHTPPADLARADRAFTRLSRHALAFDDLRSHGLRPKDGTDARALVGELAAMARVLGRTDPATLADIRLIGGALGLDGASVRLLIRAHAGVSGDWAHRAHARQAYGGFGGGAHSRSGFGQRTQQQSGQQRSAPDPNAAHYHTLGLAPGASTADVKRAWRRMAKRYHPDRFAGTEMTDVERAAVERRMRGVNAAYEALRG